MTSDHLRETLTGLDAEWRHLVDTHPQPFAPGCDAGGVITAASGLAGVLDAVDADPDATLHRLLVAHQGGDRVAGRVVLHAMVAKMVTLALADAVASLDDYLAALWEVIATFPVARRRTSIAGNLALDTLKAVKREQRRPVPGHAVPSPGPDAAHVLAAARRLGLLDAATAATLAAVYLEGRSGVAAAAHLGISPAAVRVRCHRGVRVLRERRADLVGEWAA